MDGNLRAAIVTIAATLVLFSVAQVQHLEERIDQLESHAGEARVRIELLGEEQRLEKSVKCGTS